MRWTSTHKSGQMPTVRGLKARPVVGGQENRIMRIRWKLLILLLAIALLPLGLVSWLEYRSLTRLGSELGSRTREALIERAGRQLLQVVDDYGEILRREIETLEHALRAQAREVERCLAAEPPASAVVFWAEDYDRGDHVPEGMIPSARHFRTAGDGKRVAVLITHQQQVFKLAPGADREQVADQVARLSAMVPAYRFVRQGHPRFIHWQYTALAGGVHSSYPGHGGYPAEFDPRLRPWYRRALEAGELTWNPPIVDASTGAVMLTESMPVHNPDGSPAGVTAIDIQLLDVVQGIKVPTAWSSDARTIIVAPQTQPAGGDTRLLVRAQKSYLEANQDWRTPIELEYLQSSDEAQLVEVIGDVRAGRPGLRKMPYRGRDSLWAYDSATQGTFLLLIVPYEEIVAQAVAAEANVLARTRRQLRTAGVTLAVVVVLVVLIALLGSRTVTRPVAELAATARRIADGDFAARADVTGTDELGELGRTFNEMVPQLADRMRIRQSLSLAMEVQQRLLPAEPPRIEGLDIAGRSIYCDETGGDYYDFLDLSQLGPHHLGVAVGDVTGHGIAAALLMASGRALLRSKADQVGSLAQVMSDINRQLTADTGGGRFMTLVYLLIDSQTRTLRWVCAGHDPPITYDPSTEDFGELSGAGIPLGIEASWQYEEFSGRSPANGQVIVIGTDGIWEARDPGGQMFGKEALRQLIRDNALRTAEQISTAITRELAAFRRTRAQEDDVTVVVVKVEPEAGPPAASS